MNGYPVGDMSTTPNASGTPPVPLAFDPRMATPVPPGYIPPPSIPPGPMMQPAPMPYGLPPGPYPYASQTSKYSCLITSFIFVYSY